MTPSKGVVTRFAPSPTGFLHIGSARTALFNWLYARHTGGKFLLRIEDTDKVRSTQEAIAAIFDGLSWLELDFDGEPVFQSARAERHRQVAKEMVKRGTAFKCYVTAEELEARRAELEEARARLAAAKKQAKDEKGESPLTEAETARLKAIVEELSRPFRSPYRDGKKKAPAKGAPCVIRLRAPDSGETVIEDEVQGRVVFQNKDLDDMVLLRSDGTPTYMLAVVVDDHDMGITHIIRGDDHLTNAARQSHIYVAMGWDIPSFSHIPLIHGPDGAKLSKRHGALGVDAYRAVGYLPSAMRNYLARLGWSHGDDEIFSTEEAIAWFDLRAIGRSPSRFDFTKLENLNGHYIRTTPDAELIGQLKAVLPTLDDVSDMAAMIDEEGWRKFERAMPGLKERAKTLKELAASARYLFARRPLRLDEKAQKLVQGEGAAHLAAMYERLSALPEWTVEGLEATTKAYAQASGAKLGSIAQPLRAALTGQTTSPGIFDVLFVLGRDESLGRIEDELKRQHVPGF